MYTTDFLATCYHECTHAVFDAHAKHRPLWINEGLATYFEQASVDSTRKVTIQPSADLKRKMKKIVKSRFFSIRPLIDFGHKRFHIWRETRNYTLSWGIVNFLIVTHRFEFGTILYHIGNGRDSEKVIDEEYPGGITQLEKDMILYYH